MPIRARRCVVPNQRNRGKHRGKMRSHNVRHAKVHPRARASTTLHTRSSPPVRTSSGTAVVAIVVGRLVVVVANVICRLPSPVFRLPSTQVPSSPVSCAWDRTDTFTPPTG
eukprot:3637407-Prymnesium_polylepis.2